MAREKKIFPLIEGITTADTFAVLGDKEKFLKHKHAWKAWRTLKEFGCVAYPVAEDLKRLDGSKVYADLTELQGKVTVVVPCLLPEKLKSLVADSAALGIPKIWFQEQTWTAEFQQECENQGIATMRGCVLRHKSHYPLHFLNPCYWHGLKDAKVPAKSFARYK